jgi:hypothetical protein
MTPPNKAMQPTGAASPRLIAKALGRRKKRLDEMRT